MKTPPATAAAFCAFGAELPPDELRILTDQGHRKKIRGFLQHLLEEEEKKTFAVPLRDEEACSLLIRRSNFSPENAQALISKWRRLAAELGYTGPIAWRVKAGFTLGNDPTESAQINRMWDEIKEQYPEGLGTTVESLVFWIPKALPPLQALSPVEAKKTPLLFRHLRECRRDNAGEHKQQLEMIRTRFDLPAHHLASFGSMTLLWLLIETYKKWCGGQVMELGMRVYTDLADANRVFLKEDGRRQPSIIGIDDNKKVAGVGVLPIGVEVLRS